MADNVSAYIIDTSVYGFVADFVFAGNGITRSDGDLWWVQNASLGTGLAYDASGFLNVDVNTDAADASIVALRAYDAVQDSSIANNYNLVTDLSTVVGSLIIDSSSDVTFAYVDGSLATRDTSINANLNLALDLSANKLDYIGYVGGGTSLVYGDGGASSYVGILKTLVAGSGIGISSDATTVTIDASSSSGASLAYVDGSLATRDTDISTNLTLITDLSIYVDTIPAGDVTKAYVDGSLATRDTDISTNLTLITDLSTYVDGLGGGVTQSYVDGSLAIRDADISTNLLLVLGSDASIVLINAHQTVQDTSIAANKTLITDLSTYVDGLPTTSAVWGNITGTLADQTDLATQQANQDASIAGAYLAGGATELSELDDVSISALGDTNILEYDVDSSLWVNVATVDLSDIFVKDASLGNDFAYDASGFLEVAGGVGVNQLADLTDVSISGRANGDLIQYNVDTSTWDNATPVDASEYFVFKDEILQTINTATEDASAIVLNLKNGLIVGDVTAGDYLEIDPSGTLYLYGNATEWDDLRFPMMGQNLDTATGRISYNYTELGVDFADNARFAVTEQISMIAQFPHSWKTGSAIGAHIHWLQNQNAMPNYMVSYRWVRNGQPVPSTWTDVSIGDSVFTYVSGTLAQISQFNIEVDPSIDGVSAMLDIKFYRDTANTSGLFAGTDAYTGTATVKEFDIHYEIDGFGSDSQYTK